MRKNSEIPLNGPREGETSSLYVKRVEKPETLSQPDEQCGGSEVLARLS